MGREQKMPSQASMLGLKLCQPPLQIRRVLSRRESCQNLDSVDDLPKSGSIDSCVLLPFSQNIHGRDRGDLDIVALSDSGCLAIVGEQNIVSVFGKRERLRLAIVNFTREGDVVRQLRVGLRMHDVKEPGFQERRHIEWDFNWITPWPVLARELRFAQDRLTDTPRVRKWTKIFQASPAREQVE